MTITHSDDYVEYCRETAKHAKDPHDLALRGADKHEVTHRIHRQIAKAVELLKSDDLVDIGCGDGTMLRIARDVGVRSGIGLLATEEEVALVRRYGLNVEQGLSDQLPLPDQCASVIVCNSVLLVVPRQKILPSLRQMHRIAKPGARIYVGEIPFVKPDDPSPKFNSRRQMLSHLYRQHGLRTWFGMLRRMAYWQMTGKPAVVNSGTAISFYASPEEFVAMAKSAGLELVRWWKDEHCETRNNYLLRKPE